MASDDCNSEGYDHTSSQSSSQPDIPFLQISVPNHNNSYIQSRNHSHARGIMQWQWHQPRVTVPQISPYGFPVPYVSSPPAPSNAFLHHSRNTYNQHVQQQQQQQQQLSPPIYFSQTTNNLKNPDSTGWNLNKPCGSDRGEESRSSLENHITPVRLIKWPQTCFVCGEHYLQKEGDSCPKKPPFKPFVLCYRCGEEGHRIDTCDKFMEDLGSLHKDITCAVCGKKGHLYCEISLKTSTPRKPESPKITTKIELIKPKKSKIKKSPESSGEMWRSRNADLSTKRSSRRRNSGKLGNSDSIKLPHLEKISQYSDVPKLEINDEEFPSLEYVKTDSFLPALQKYVGISAHEKLAADSNPMPSSIPRLESSTVHDLAELRLSSGVPDTASNLVTEPQSSTKPDELLTGATLEGGKTLVHICCNCGDSGHRYQTCNVRRMSREYDKYLYFQPPLDCDICELPVVNVSTVCCECGRQNRQPKGSTQTKEAYFVWAHQLPQYCKQHTHRYCFDPFGCAENFRRTGTRAHTAPISPLSPLPLAPLSPMDSFQNTSVSAELPNSSPVLEFLYMQDAGRASGVHNTHGGMLNPNPHPAPGNVSPRGHVWLSNCL